MGMLSRRLCHSASHSPPLTSYIHRKTHRKTQVTYKCSQSHKTHPHTYSHTLCTQMHMHSHAPRSGSCTRLSPAPQPAPPALPGEHAHDAGCGAPGVVAHRVEGLWATGSGQGQNLEALCTKTRPWDTGQVSRAGAAGKDREGTRRPGRVPRG